MEEREYILIVPATAGNWQWHFVTGHCADGGHMTLDQTAAKRFSLEDAGTEQIALEAVGLKVLIGLA